MSLLTLRRVYQAFFLGLFVFLLGVARTGWIGGWPVDLFLHLSPLLSVGLVLAGQPLRGGAILSLVVGVSGFLAGRAFCGWVCPLGTLQDAVASLVGRRGARAQVSRPWYQTKYLLLAVALGAAASGWLVVGWVDPLSLLVRGFAATVGSWVAAVDPLAWGKREVPPGEPLAAVVLVCILAATAVVPRLWCRALCPLGAFLGLCGSWAVWGIRRDEGACTSCGLCERTCHGAANPSTDVRRSECVACMHCRTGCPEGAISWGILSGPWPQRRRPDLRGRRMVLAALGGLATGPLLRSSPRQVPAWLVRPPGALPETDFLARCVRCGMCARVCPTGVIRLAGVEGGLEQLWTPVMDFDVGYCEVSCVLCGHSCPTGALRPLGPSQKQAGEVRVGTASIDPTRCLPWAWGIPCVVCQEVCPVSPKAIRTDPPEGQGGAVARPRVDPSLCIGCGVCQFSCPVRGPAAIRVSPAGETRNPEVSRQRLPRSLPGATPSD